MALETPERCVKSTVHGYAARFALVPASRRVRRTDLRPSR